MVFLLQGGLVEDVDQMDFIRFDEIPQSFVRWCKGSIFTTTLHIVVVEQKWTCMFNDDDMDIKQHNSINPTWNRVIYYSRGLEGLNLIRYNAEISRKYLAHIKVERTQGRRAIAYLMKYSLKLPKPVDVSVYITEERVFR